MSKTIDFFFLRQKLKFMESSRVWYQVNHPDPSNNFCAPPENQLMPWNVSDGPGPILSVFFALIVHCELKSVHPGFPVAFIF